MKTIVALFVAFAASAAFAEPILVIGDSHSCGPFGAKLVERLTAQGNDVTLYCAVSSAPAHWFNGKNPSGEVCKTMTSATKKLVLCGGDGKVPKLEDLLKQNKGSKVIAALGTNSMANPKTDSTYRKMAEAIKAADHSCLWVGPPHVHPSESKGFPAGRVDALEKNVESFYESLTTSVVGNCVLLDSRAVTAAGRVGNQTTDGVHRNKAAGEAWADFVASGDTASGGRRDKVAR